MSERDKKSKSEKGLLFVVQRRHIAN